MINQDYYQQRNNRRHHTHTDPNLDTQRIPYSLQRQRSDAKTVRVDVQRRGKRPFSFYVKSALVGGAAILSIAAWILVPQAIHHYHSGDNPTNYYTVVKSNERCDAFALLNSDHNVIDVLILPQSAQSKVTPEAHFAKYDDTDQPEITLQTNMDVNGDGKSDIIVLANDRQIGVLLANKNGTSFEWSKQS